MQYECVSKNVVHWYNAIHKLLFQANRSVGTILKVA